MLLPSSTKANSTSFLALPATATRGHSSPEAARVEEHFPRGRGGVGEGGREVWVKGVQSGG